MVACLDDPRHGCASRDQWDGEPCVNCDYPIAPWSRACGNYRPGHITGRCITCLNPGDVHLDGESDG